MTLSGPFTWVAPLSPLLSSVSSEAYGLLVGILDEVPILVSDGRFTRRFWDVFCDFIIGCTPGDPRVTSIILGIVALFRAGGAIGPKSDP